MRKNRAMFVDGSVLISAAIAVLVSAAVNFVMNLGSRARVVALEQEIVDLQSSMISEKRRRASAASHAARGGISELDAALVKQHTGMDIENETAVGSAVRAIRGAVK